MAVGMGRGMTPNAHERTSLFGMECLISSATAGTILQVPRLPPVVPASLLTDSAARSIAADGLGDAGVADPGFAWLTHGHTQFMSIRTNGDGACALHSAFGELGARELFCPNARQRAVRVLRPHLLAEGAGLPTQCVRASIWSELARPAASFALNSGEEPSSESELFWELASPELRRQAEAQVLAQEAAAEHARATRSTLRQLARVAFDPSSAAFVAALHARLKPLYGAIADFDVESFGAYPTKLEACLDAAAQYDCLREALLQPARSALSSVAQIVYDLCDAQSQVT